MVMVRLPPNLLRHVTFPHSDAVGVSSVPDRLKLYGEKLQVIPKRDTHLVNLGRGGRHGVPNRVREFPEVGVENYV